MPATSWKDLMKTADEGAKEFEPLPEDWYTFVIKEPAKLGQTQKGNPRYTVRAVVESGNRVNASVLHDFTVSDNAFAMKVHFFGALATLGLGPEFFEADPSDDQITAALQGRRFTARVEHEKSATNGKTYARLKDIQLPTSAPPAGGAGVPSGLPAPMGAPAGLPVGAPVTAAAPAASTVPASPWADAPAAPSVPTPPAVNNVPLPPAFG
jgi:hypothetical protein